MKNEPAFPVKSSDGICQYSGMTLRDYFAAKAMQAYIPLDNWTEPEEKIAQLAYKQADAMLLERERVKND